jgi:hypothetical protein
MLAGERVSTLTAQQRAVVRHAIDQAEAHHDLREARREAFLWEHACRNAETALTEARQEIGRLERRLARKPRKPLDTRARAKIIHLEAALRAACERNRILAARPSG